MLGDYKVAQHNAVYQHRKSVLINLEKILDGIVPPKFLHEVANFVSQNFFDKNPQARFDELCILMKNIKFREILLNHHDFGKKFLCYCVENNVNKLNQFKQFSVSGQTRSFIDECVRDVKVMQATITRGFSAIPRLTPVTILSLMLNSFFGCCKKTKPSQVPANTTATVVTSALGPDGKFDINIIPPTPQQRIR